MGTMPGGSDAPTSADGCCPYERRRACIERASLPCAGARARAAPVAVGIKPWLGSDGTWGRAAGWLGAGAGGSGAPGDSELKNAPQAVEQARMICRALRMDLA